MKLAANRFGLAEHQRNIWRVALDEGIQLEAVQESSFWAHTASKLRPGDKIEVLPEDGGWYAELLVRDADRLWAKVDILSHHVFDAPAEQPVSTTGYEVQWKGPVRKFAVVRLDDKQVMSEKHATRDSAGAWLISFTRQAA